MNGHDGNVAFKCTYNDGGAKGFVGFRHTTHRRKKKSSRGGSPTTNWTTRNTVQPNSIRP